MIDMTVYGSYCAESLDTLFRDEAQFIRRLIAFATCPCQLPNRVDNVFLRAAWIFAD